MGLAALFTPPPIHKSNMVLFPSYLRKSRLKQFANEMNGQYTIDADGLVTIVNQLVEFHYKAYHRHIELVDMSIMPSTRIDATRCLEFLKYESYLFQKPICANLPGGELEAFLQEHGFRIIEDDEEKQEIFESFWEKEPAKAR